MCLGVFVLSKEAITIYAGSKYMDAVVPLMIACITRIFISMESVMNNLVMYPNDREDRILKISLICGVTNLVINYILVFLKIFNPITALATTGIIEFVIFMIQYVYAKRKMNVNINIFNKKNFTYVMLGLLFIPISLLIRKFNINFYLNMGLIIMACMTLYVGVLFVRKDNNLMFILEKIKLKVRKN